MFRLSLLFIAFLSVGCVSLDPDYQRPDAPVPAMLAGNSGQSATVIGNWQQVVKDTRLQKVISLALNSNRDIQKAIADIDAARAQYGETQASLFPTLNGELSESRSRTSTAGISGNAQAQGTVSSFELDLFGRNQSLSRAAHETWLASEYTAQNTRLTMIAEISSAWVQLATDNSNLMLAQQTRNNAADALNITKRQMEMGTAALTDVSAAMGVYQEARASVANYQTLVMQDKNALNLLAGQTVTDDLLPGTLDSLASETITLVPANISSSQLLNRPDIQEAEHNLLSANANIGAARANFFPTISLTSSAGIGSDSLSSLFNGGMKIWSFSPSVTLPLFTGGSNLAQLRYAEAQKTGLIARYEKAIQSAFKDVADALARRQTLNEELDAQSEYVAAEQQTFDIAMKRYQAGSGDYLTALTAQRTLWSAQRSLLTLQQTELNNRITLWQSLGGGINKAS